MHYILGSVFLDSSQALYNSEDHQYMPQATIAIQGEELHNRAGRYSKRAALSKDKLLLSHNNYCKISLWTYLLEALFEKLVDYIVATVHSMVL